MTRIKHVYVQLRHNFFSLPPNAFNLCLAESIHMEPADSKGQWWTQRTNERCFVGPSARFSCCPCLDGTSASSRLWNQVRVKPAHHRQERGGGLGLRMRRVASDVAQHLSRICTESSLRIKNPACNLPTEFHPNDGPVASRGIAIPSSGAKSWATEACRRNSRTTETYLLHLGYLLLVQIVSFCFDSWLYFYLYYLNLHDLSLPTACQLKLWLVKQKQV